MGHSAASAVVAERMDSRVERSIFKVDDGGGASLSERNRGGGINARQHCPKILIGTGPKPLPFLDQSFVKIIGLCI